MHVLGGIVVALGMLSFYPLHHARTSASAFMGTLLVVLTVGVLWEVFEYIFGISLIAGSERLPDTSLDLLMDLVGGAVGFGVARSVRVLDEETGPEHSDTNL